MIDPLHSAGPFTHEIVASLLDPPDEKFVLDLGAGPGNFTAYLERSGHNVIAVDIDENDYRDAGHTSAPFLSANLDESLPDLPGPLGGVIAIEIIEHLESPLRFMRTIAGALADGGWLIITTPNVSSLSSRLELLVRGHNFQFSEEDYRTNGHISPVSLRQFEYMAARLGLAIETTTYNVGRIPLPRLRQRILIRGDWARSGLLGESLIIKFRKHLGSARRFTRG